MALYVCFDDSPHDPTYTSADSAWLVDSDDGDGNPCAPGRANRKVPILPSNLEEIEAFASIMEWSVETDNEGQIILYTGVNKRSQ